MTKELEVFTVGTKIKQNKKHFTVKFSDRNYKPLVLTGGKNLMPWDLFEC